MKPRLVVLGGSSVSTPGLALALRDVASEQGLTLVLHGRSPEKLEVVAQACGHALRDVGTVFSELDLRAALDGADLVLNQVRVGGLQARQFDESFPRLLGLVAEETLGAGGFANALRTIPVVLELAEELEVAAPAAVLVNLTNPASLVQQALARRTAVKSISVCDIPVALARLVHELLRAEPDTLEVDYFGTNHVGWVTAARDPSGADRLGEAIEHLGTVGSYPLDASFVKTLGVLPGPYLRYLYHPDRYASANGRTRAEDLLDVESVMLAEYAALPPDATADDVKRVVARRQPHWYDEIVVPVVEALLSDVPRRLVVQVTNEGHAPGLPDRQTIELPTAISRAAIEPMTASRLPRNCQAVLEQNAAYEELAVEAILDHDRSKALRALALNPLIGTIDNAAAVGDVVWPAD